MCLSDINPEAREKMHFMLFAMFACNDDFIGQAGKATMVEFKETFGQDTVAFFRY